MTTGQPNTALVQPSSRSVLGTARRLLDRHYLLILALIMVPLIGLHVRIFENRDRWSGDTWKSIDEHLDLRDVIRGGFDPNRAVRVGTPTYPMWGYAWILLFTEKYGALLTIQNSLALVSIACLVRALTRTHALSPGQLTAFKLLLLVSLPFYAFHGRPCADSIGASLVIIILSLLPWVFEGDSIRFPRLLALGILMGIATNFRPDLLLLPIALVPVILWAGRRRWRQLAGLAFCFASVLILLIPWAMYTHRATGHALLTSTNAGITMLEGFGFKGTNRWGITHTDDDPFILGLIAAHFPGREFPGQRPGMTYEPDQFLKGEFVRLVREAPSEYVRRILRTVRQLAIGGTYCGEFYSVMGDSPQSADEAYFKVRSAMIHNPLRCWSQYGAAVPLCALQVCSSLSARLLLLFACGMLPLVAIFALWRRHLLLLSFVLVTLYFFAIVCLISAPEPRYLSPLYPLYLLYVVLGLSLIAGWFRRPRTA